MDKRLQLKVIIKKCEEKFGRGNSEDWKHNDYIDFSKSILGKTKISISHNTLKRIFGKLTTDEFYLPQKATFDALIDYSGFDVSEEFNDDYLLESPVVETSAIPFKAHIKKKSNVILAVILFFSVIVASYFFFKNSPFNADDVSLKLTASEGILPKTCFFSVDVANVSDSVFVDFGDKTSLVYLKANEKTVSHTYFIPGVFDVSITNKTKGYKKTRVFVTTNYEKWYALCFQRQRLIPKSYYGFLANKNKDGLFNITNRELQIRNIDTIQPFFVRLCNYTPLKKTADNFVFETTFKKDIQKEEVSCDGLVFKVSGAENDIRFHFVNSGCTSRVANIVSDKIINGIDHNLSPFVVDFKKWNTIKLINSNKKLILFVNEKLIYETTYTASLGDLRGLFVEFENNGFIKKCDLSSPDGKKYYSF